MLFWYITANSDPWQLVLRAYEHSGRSIHDSWLGIGPTADTPTNKRADVFREPLLDVWNDLNVLEVRLPNKIIVPEGTCSQFLRSTSVDS